MSNEHKREDNIKARRATTKTLGHQICTAEMCPVHFSTWLATKVYSMSPPLLLRSSSLLRRDFSVVARSSDMKKKNYLLNI